MVMQMERETTQGTVTTLPGVSASATETSPDPEPLQDPEGEPTDSEAPSYEDWYAQLDKHGTLKAEHETRSREREKELGKEQYRKFQSAIQPAIDRWSQNSAQSREVLGSMATGLQRAVRDRILDADTVQDLFQNNRQALDAFNGNMWWEGTFYVLNTLGKLAEDESVANEFIARLHQSTATGRPDANFGTDLMDRLTEGVVKDRLKAAEDKGYQRGLKEGQKVSKEENRADNRGGKGPDLTTKRSSAPKSKYTLDQLKKMTRDEILSIPREERDRILAA